MSLFEAGRYYYENEDYPQAQQLWEKVITSYPESDYAVKALVQLFHLSKCYKTDDFAPYLTKILNGDKVPAALYRKAMILETYFSLREGNKEAALLLAKEMITEKHKGTQAELYGLYTLAMSDDKGAQEALNTLKERFPNNTLTNIAREEHNESVNWQNGSLDKSLVDGKGEYFNHNSGLPDKFALYKNFPNPFNPTTTIKYDLPEDVNVTITVYNNNGQKIKELVNGFKQAGSYQVIFNASGLASGIYFYKIQTGDFTNVKRMLLIK
jgi:tetratricopeptide (TPR) repeat protein